MTPQQLEAMNLALEALRVVTKEMMAIRDELAEYGEGRPITNGNHQLLWDSSFKAYTETAIPAYAALEKALAEHAMRETQRLGQEIEQEPVAWQWLGSAHFRKKLPKNADITAWNPLYTAPPQRTEQSPVADDIASILACRDMLDAQPVPPRTWVGLTDEDMYVVSEEESCSFIAGAKWSEEILKGKNT